MPLTMIHPGEHLAEELSELGMSAAELARRLNVPTKPQSPKSSRTASHHRRYGAYAWPTSLVRLRNFG